LGVALLGLLLDSIPHERGSRACYWSEACQVGRWSMPPWWKITLASPRV
jgi:hypothetical protein